MNWNSPAEFFTMGGYALYVWGSFLACAIFLTVEPLLLRQRRKQAVTQLKREISARNEHETET